MAIAGMQPMLSLPCDRVHLRADLGLALSKRATHSGPVAIRPGRLDDAPPKVRVAGFGDAPAANPFASGIFTRDGTAVPHQLSRVGEPRELADFRDDCHGRDLRNPTQRLQRLD